MFIGHVHSFFHQTKLKKALKTYLKMILYFYCFYCFHCLCVCRLNQISPVTCHLIHYLGYCLGSTADQ